MTYNEILKYMMVDPDDIIEIALYSLPLIKPILDGKKRRLHIHKGNDLKTYYDYFKSLKVPFCIDFKLNSTKEYLVMNNGFKEHHVLYNPDGTLKIILSEDEIEDVIDEYNKSLANYYLLMENI